MFNKKPVLGEEKDVLEDQNGRRAELILCGQNLRKRVQLMTPEEKGDIVARLPKHPKK